MDNTSKPLSYLALDGEFGGIDLKYSLLTVYFRVLDEDFQMVSDLDLCLKPDDGSYVLSAKGMEVNGINLVQHDKTAITYKDGKDILRKWLYGLSQMNGYNRLNPLGHNVAGDIRHVQDKLIDREKWEQYVSYRHRDTAVIGGYLIDRGLVPDGSGGAEGVSGSLASWGDYFGIKPFGTLHTAKTDTLLTIEVYKKMLKVRLNE